MKLTVDREDAGRRLDSLIGDLIEVGSRSAGERLVRDGRVTVNGRLAAKSLRVTAGDVIEVDLPGGRGPAPLLPVGDDVAVAIVWQDEHVLVVDKPAGLVVHPAPGLRERTLVDLVEAAGMSLAEDEDPLVHRPGVVHRLDRDTSGLMMLARTPTALRTLQQSIQQRLVRREYITLVEGHTPSRAGRIEAPIGRDVRDATRRSLDTDHPQDAITHFVVSDVLPTTTLLKVRLETGRTHQIRVHMQAIGHPVIGDSTYGHGPAFGLTRQFLHSAHLSFPHPETGETVEVHAALPDDLRSALDEARHASVSA